MTTRIGGSKPRRALGVLIAVSLTMGVVAIGPAVGARKELKPYSKAVADKRYVQEAETFRGAFSCAGTSWQTGESGDEFNANGLLREPTGEGAFPGAVFVCNAVLPNGARIKAVRFSIQDNSDTEEVVSMVLNRHRLSPPIGETDILASIPGTGNGQTPGNQLASTTQISKPVVDNVNYAYSLVCVMDPSPQLGLWGATVEYSVTGARGAAA